MCNWISHFQAFFFFQIAHSALKSLHVIANVLLYQYRHLIAQIKAKILFFHNLFDKLAFKHLFKTILKHKLLKQNTLPMQ